MTQFSYYACNTLHAQPGRVNTSMNAKLSKRWPVLFRFTVWNHTSVKPCHTPSSAVIPPNAQLIPLFERHRPQKQFYCCVHPPWGSNPFVRCKFICNTTCFAFFCTKLKSSHNKIIQTQDFSRVMLPSLPTNLLKSIRVFMDTHRLK